MKIVYLTHQYFPRHVGGTEVYTHGLATRAQKAGHEVLVITHVESPSLERADYRAVATEYQGVPVIELHHNLSRADHPARAEYDNPQIAELLKPVLEATKPDLVHALHGMKLSGAALQLCYDQGVPVILTLADYWFTCPRHTLLRSNHELCRGPAHDLDCLRCSSDTHGFAAGRMQHLPGPLLRLVSDAGLLKEQPFWRDIQALRKRQAYLREIVARADCVIALSDFQKAMYVRNGFHDAKIRVMQHGLETDGLRGKMPSTGNHHRLLFIGSLVYHKGAHVLIEALARRPETNFELLIYGDAGGANPYLDSLKRKAAADARVKLMGTFPVADMGRVLETATALAMPALWYENEPLVVKAAQYIGLPVLASNIGTLGHSIRQGVNGLLIPPGDVEAWAEAISSFIPMDLDPDPTIKSMNENARELFELYDRVHSSRQ